MRKIKYLAVLILLPIMSYSQQLTEILGRPTNNSITINVLFDTSVETYFEYGNNKGNYTNQTTLVTSVNEQPVETKIEGLTPATRYYYRTRYRKVGQFAFLASPEHTFITQQKPGTTFRFTVESDPHPYDKKGCWPLWDICLANQLSDTADFMIDMGDTFGDDHNPTTITSADVKQLQLNCRNFLGKVCHSLPFFFCIGNHEGESGYYLLQTPPYNLAMYETNWRKLYFPNPYPDGFFSGDTIVEGNGIGKIENYYSWQWGDALFVILDVYRYANASEKPQKWDFTIGEDQYNWFKKTLETSNAKFKFVFAHHVLGQGRGGIELAKSFEWGGYDAGKYAFDTKRPGWDLPLHQLMSKNKVDIFFQGHDHIYVKQDLDGVVYQSVPMPSDSSYKIGVTDNGDAYLSGKQLDGSGHLRVTVSSDSVRVEYISAILPMHETASYKNKMVRDAYSIVKKSTNTGFQDVITNKNSEPVCKIYPNPCHDFINILFNNLPQRKLTIEIINMDGRIIEQIQWNGGESIPYTLNLKDIKGYPVSPGVYALRIIADDNILTKTLVVQ